MKKKKYTLLTSPLGPEAMDKDGWVEGVVGVDVSEIIGKNTETFLDLLSRHLVGNDLLSDFDWNVVGHTGDFLHIRVCGDASLAFDHE